ncbi:hypothetical protein GWK41_05715 [Persephonella atlantica]|uniref:Uncharacterized protein n=1 Tax=Persephonella atlantica TaxID=2699429 RepID=A0ABS1GI20_9AQUI|nr:hypothetical protein [Persephonella atlantica]MBK3332557.1 hypothetical protein [Persephonella atlantica]
MRDLIKFFIGFVAGFIAVYRLLSKKEEETDKSQPQLEAFSGDGRIIDVLKKFNEIKKNI